MDECDICCLKMNKTSRKQVECPACGQQCCVSCFKEFLLSLETTATCMNTECGCTLTLDFIARVTPKEFHNKIYRKHRASVELGKQMGMLAATQYLVAQRVEKKKLEEIIEEIAGEEAYHKDRLAELRVDREKIRHQIGVLENKSPQLEKRQFVRACPNGNCRGFLSSAWKCGTCEKYACRDCNGVKNERDDKDHVCDEGDKATIALLAQDTKPCPKCGTFITKVKQSCDQMYCYTDGCNTQFSWTRGVITNDAHHNPHYFQYMREKNNGVVPRNEGDRPGGNCGNAPTERAIIEVLKRRNHKFNNLSECLRIIPHIRHVVMNKYPLPRVADDETDLRLQYLLREITDDEMLRQLQNRVKKREKNMEINGVLQAFTDMLDDLFTTYVYGTINTETPLEHQVNALKDYTNRELLAISKVYNNKAPHIKSNWEII